MATKNLARTVVEGGRDTYSKLYRKLRNRSERRLRFDLESDVMQGQERVGGSRGFADRLAPLERWLGSNVGRGWSNVYREFCERFDERTMKGWHVHWTPIQRPWLAQGRLAPPFPERLETHVKTRR